MRAQLMELQFRYNRYKLFKERLSKMLSALAPTSSHLSNAKTSIDSTFTYNGIGADEGGIQSLITSVNNVMSSLTKISNRLDIELQNLEAKITQLQNAS